MDKPRFKQKWINNLEYFWRYENGAAFDWVLIQKADSENLRNFKRVHSILEGVE